MRKIFICFIALILGSAAFAQVKIGGTDGTPNANAMLEIEADNKGFLPPRVALQGINVAAPLTAHIAGITLYNTATAGTGTNIVTPGYYYNDGTKWVRLLTEVKADNGTHTENGTVKLGGTLTKNTTITTGGTTNTLAIDALINIPDTQALTDEKIVVATGSDGELKTVNAQRYAPATNTTVYKSKIANNGNLLNVAIADGWRPVNFGVSTDTFHNGSIAPMDSSGNLIIQESGIYAVGFYFRHGTGVQISLLDLSTDGTGIRIRKTSGATTTTIDSKQFSGADASLGSVLGINIGLLKIIISSSEINSVFALQAGDVLNFQTRLGGLGVSLLSSSEANLYLYKISEIAE